MHKFFLVAQLYWLELSYLFTCFSSSKPKDNLINQDDPTNSHVNAQSLLSPLWIYDSHFVGSYGAGPNLIQIVESHNQLLRSLFNANISAQMAGINKQLDVLAREILKNNHTSPQPSKAYEWLSLNDEFAKLLQAITEEARQNISEYLSTQAKRNLMWFIGVLIALILVLITSTVLLFWYAFKSERLLEQLITAEHTAATKVPCIKI